MTEDPRPSHGRERRPFKTKFDYGLGQVAEGLKTRIFETFVFFYYVQVLGLP